MEPNDSHQLHDDLVIEDEKADEIDDIHVKYDIASYPSDLTLSGIKQMWDKDAIVIPGFQRNFVWSIHQASLLIDSFLCGLPVPPVFFFIDSNNQNLVIDGQQRIMSIVFFLDGYFGQEDSKNKKTIFKLKLAKNHPYNGLSFNDLPEEEQRKLEFNSILRAINIRQLNPLHNHSSAYHIFERLNTGGTPLKPQEIRNCVYNGNLVEVLKNLNKDKNWRDILGKHNEDKHQKDIELILRILSFVDDENNYEKPLKEFLNKTMDKHRHADTDTIEQFKIKFKHATKMIIDQLGKKPFNHRGPLNASLLESVMVILIKDDKKISSDIKSSYEAFTSDTEFDALTTAGTTDASTTKSRFKLARKHFIHNVLQR